MTFPVLLMAVWALTGPVGAATPAWQQSQDAQATGAQARDSQVQETQEGQDAQPTQDASTPFDSIWAGNEIPTQEPSPLEQVMLSHDKLYVVLAVVLIIWVGIVVLLLRNDAHLRRLERTAEQHISDEETL